MTINSKAYKEIINILSKLNVFEASCVLKAVSKSVSNGDLNYQKPRSFRKSKIQLDRELYDFILSFDLHHIAQRDVIAACIEEFGIERAPSRTSLCRAWPRLVALQLERDHEI